MADFVGSSNVLPPEFVAAITGEHRWASLRPEAIRLTESGGHEASVIGTSFLGGSTRLALEVGDLRMHLLVPSTAALPKVGDGVRIDWDRNDLHLMEAGA